ncbi:MAG: MerC domain-containing protein [Chitinophagaceae bacterium]|nr:MAG: MerC domain-containing protein [Chitinophagaceae bacterium]
MINFYFRYATSLHIKINFSNFVKKVKIVNWNKIGVFASLACAVHCALTPLLLVMAPLTGLMLFDHWVEIVMISFSIVIASYANVNSFINTHKNRKPLLWMVSGFLLIISVHIVHAHGPVSTVLSVLGALMVAWSLIYNQKLIKKTCSVHAA